MTTPELADSLLLPVPLDAGPDAPVVLARAAWPAAEDDRLTPVAGFVLSTFSPLVAEVAERCLRARYGDPPARPAHAGATALVLASAHGDVTTTEAAATAAEAGRRVPPLLFFQSNPNAVLGWVAARWELDGPVVSIAPTGNLLAGAQAVAELLIADGEAAEVLVLAAELDPDRAEAVLLGTAQPRSVLLPAEPPAPAAELVAPEPPPAVATELILPEPPPAVATELILPEPPADPVAQLIVPTATEEQR